MPATQRLFHRRRRQKLFSFKPISSSPNVSLQRKVKSLKGGAEVAERGEMSIDPLLLDSPLKDEFVTETSIWQDETVEECVPLLADNASSRSVPHLRREDHIAFLKNQLQNATYIAYDASRPWVLYWSLTALCALGQDVIQYRQSVIETLTPAQNASGGFGGGHGFLSHCAPCYAAVLSLAMVGGEEALDLIDRRALWRWLGQIKQADGGFKMCVGGEEDVRGAYCSLVILSLLALPLELPPDAPSRTHGLSTFVDGLPEYFCRCQTFEGGISGAPQTEAHGAYAFCVLAGLCILGPPDEMLQRYLDVPMLISWLSSRQYFPEGGFSGRTNKLVDGCYSHWVGGCWPLLNVAVRRVNTHPQSGINSLYSKEGLIRYILSCCQAEDGGLRDKPSTRPDLYHSCYTLAGLSSAQHSNAFPESAGLSPSNSLTSAFQWRPQTTPVEELGAPQMPMWEPKDTLLGIHPIYVIPWEAVEGTRAYFATKFGF